MSIAAQTAVGDIGSKAVSELSFSFGGMVNCGKFQFGLNETGVFLLNSGDNDNNVPFERSFTLVTSDYGKMNNKRFRYVYLKIEVYENTDITVAVRQDKGSWVQKTKTIVGPGLKTVTFAIPRKNGEGNLHSVKVSGSKRFRVLGISGLAIVRSLGVIGRL